MVKIQQQIESAKIIVIFKLRKVCMLPHSLQRQLNTKVKVHFHIVRNKLHYNKEFSHNTRAETMVQ